MLHSEPGKRGLRRELDVALESQIQRLDLLIARVWQVLALTGLLGGIVLSLLMPGRLGLTLSATSGVFLGYFTFHATALERGRGGTHLLALGTAVESAVPWVFMLVLYSTEGAAYALGSWLPPLLVGVLVIAATARLRPLMPVIVGVSSGVLFLSLYLLLLRFHIDPNAEPRKLFSPGMQLSRSLSLMGGGLAASLITRSLRDAIGRAERSVREQDLFGKYRLESKIASGGMGVVHRATYCPEGGFERLVAVKLLHAHLAEQESFLAAFRSEAELSARLVHPNIVQVLDFGRTATAYFLAMEFIDGMTLASFMRRLLAHERRLPAHVAAFVVREILEGLAFSHHEARDAEGRPLRVVHRDLCPANVLVSRAGNVKIADFGIARALRDTDTSLTRTVAGHIGYMAPEQAQRGVIDERCDLFAAGVIAWELLALRPLFQRGNEGQTLLALLSNEVPPLAGERPDLDPAWDGWLKRSMALAPSTRFASASEMLDGLRKLRAADAKAAGQELAELVRWASAAPDPGATAGWVAREETDDPEHRTAPTKIVTRRD